MEEQAGTKLRAKTVKQGHPVDCQDWLEFAILEVKYDGIRVRYREIATGAGNVILSRPDDEPSKALKNL